MIKNKNKMQVILAVIFLSFFLSLSMPTLAFAEFSETRFSSESSSVEETPEPPVNFCPDCGSPRKENSKFCESCGTALNEEQLNDQQSISDGSTVISSYDEDKAPNAQQEKTQTSDLCDLSEEVILKYVLLILAITIVSTITYMMLMGF